MNVVTKSLVFPQWLLATLPTIKCLHIPNLHLPSVNTLHRSCLPYGALRCPSSYFVSTILDALLLNAPYGYAYQNKALEISHRGIATC